MKFKVIAKSILIAILLTHVVLAIFDLKFLIFPWIYLIYRLWILSTGPLGSPWVPASMDEVEQMLRMADIKSGEILYDLGSGDGRIVTEAAKLYKVKAIGVEIDPIKVIFSRLKSSFSKVRHHVEIKHANLFDISLAGANVVTMFLVPTTVNKLKTKFKKELKKGSRIVSLKFPLKNWKPIKVNKTNAIFVYKI